MEKNYKEIQFSPGETIESAIKELRTYKDAFGVFNGQRLYSDIDDVESAYKKITGKTKAECDAETKRWNDEYEEKERKHKEDMPKLIVEWTQKGNAILDSKYHEKWAKCVSIRLGDLYHGMELGATLEIVEQLNKGCKLEITKDIIDRQGHSGMSYSLVCSMVKAFCDRGSEFYNYVRS